MSTNFHIKAERKVQVLKTGNLETQTEYIEVWQTPTKQTQKICSSESPLQAYFDYVLSISEDETVPVYAEDDIFQVNEPIGSKIVNYGKVHVEGLGAYIKELEKEGYELEFEAW